MEEWVLSLLNMNRVAAAVSKVGDAADRANWSVILELVLEDIATDTGAECEVFARLREQLRCRAYDMLVDDGVELAARKQPAGPPDVDVIVDSAELLTADEVDVFTLRRCGYLAQ